MKTLLKAALLSMALVLTIAISAYTQTPDSVIVTETPAKPGIMQYVKWIWENWEAIISALLGVIAALDVLLRLTPTEKDNNVLRIIQSWLDRLIPNRRKEGGNFVAFSDPEDAPAAGYVGKKNQV